MEEITKPTQLEQKYEVCCLPAKGGRQVRIFGNYPIEDIENFKGKVALDEWRKRAELYIPKSDYDLARGHIINVQSDVISKERKMGEKDGCYIFGLDFCEYASFIKRLREKILNRKNREVQTTPSYAAEEKTQTWNKKKLPEDVIEKSINLGRKRKNQSLVPSYLVTPTWKQ